MSTASIPYIDPNVEHVGVSKLRKLNSRELRKITKAMVLQENDTPLAVLLNYKQFLIMQNQLFSLLETIELLASEQEVASLVSGLRDWKAGRTRPLSEIRESLRKKK